MYNYIKKLIIFLSVLFFVELRRFWIMFRGDIKYICWVWAFKNRPVFGYNVENNTWMIEGKKTLEVGFIFGKNYIFFSIWSAHM